MAIKPTATVPPPDADPIAAGYQSNRFTDKPSISPGNNPSRPAPSFHAGEIVRKQPPGMLGTMSTRKNRTSILAKSLFRELAAQGYEMHHVVALANALIDEAIEQPSPAQAAHTPLSQVA